MSSPNANPLDWRRLRNNAEDFRLGAEMLLRHSGPQNNPNRAIPASTIVLTGFAWEVFFKAYLAKQNVSDKNIIAHGHDLAKLRVSAEALGWSFENAVKKARDRNKRTSRDQQWTQLIENALSHFEKISELTTGREFQARYPTKINAIPWPEFQFEILRFAIEDL